MQTMKPVEYKYLQKTRNLSPNIFKTKNGKLIMRSKCADSGFK